MPFIQRIIEPVTVSRGEVPKGIKNELECVTNNTLSNVIAQLSNLSKQAEDMFLALSQEAAVFDSRAKRLQNRINHLQDKVTQLDAAGEVVSLQELHQRKPYKGSIEHDQQVVSRSTVSRSILNIYSKCDPTPALDKLNAYREDGKDCMKFYTDPNYFFELWYQEIQKDIEQKKNELKDRKKRRRPKDQNTARKKPKQVQTRADKYKNLGKGLEFSSDYQDPRELRSKTSQGFGPDKQQNHVQQGQQVRPESLSVQDPQHNHNSAHISEDKRTSKQNGPSPGIHNRPSQHVTQRTDINGGQHPQYKQHNDYNQQQLSPQQHRDSRNIRNSATMSPARPTQPPPAPPPIMGDNRQSPARDSLPPPPPPPPMEAGYTPSPHGTPNLQERQSKMRNTPLIQDSGLRGMEDLPPPPPPPPLSPEFDPVIPAPPPVSMAGHGGMAPPPPPPPPPPPSVPQGLVNGMDNLSVNSESGSETSSSITSRPSNVPAPSSDRSDLLAEIRKGTMMGKLRKVDDREREVKKSKAEHGNFDVHSIMTRAFDMRRKALEDSDSGNSDSEDEQWDD